MNFNVTIEEANLILQALAELPFRVSQSIIAKLQEQAKQQLEKQSAAE